MNRKYIYTLLGATFLSFLLIVFHFMGGGQERKPQPAKEVLVETPPFFTYINATGVVEPASGNVTIAPSLSRLVEKVPVAVNQRVKRGDVLFEQFNQDLKSNLQIKQARYEEALANLSKLEAVPRKEDLIIAEENLNKAQAIYNREVLEYYKNMRCARGSDKCLLFYKYQEAEADFQAAQAQYAKVRNGTWQPELQIAQHGVDQAKAEIDAMQAELDRTSVRSPLDGTVLQIKIHEGEFADPSRTAILLGNIEELNLRVSIDQFNEARFVPACPAVAFKQGNTTQEFPLEFIHIEPFMVPKKYLTNELHEKVDTQIFEILYRIKKHSSHLFIGEQMNVYIYEEKK